MRRKSLLRFAILVLFLLQSQSVLAAPVDQDQSVVKAVLFWMPGCPSCLEVLQDFIPNVITDIEPIPKSSGMTLAAVTLAGLLLTLALIIANMIRGFQGKLPLYSIKWSQSLIPILAVLGLGVAIYLSYVEITAVPAICGPVGDCNTVQQSQYARILGVLPVGLAGMGGYLAILVAWAWGRLRKDQLAEYVPIALFGMTVFGTLYSVYLTYLEIYIIHAVCIWCITSAVVIGLLALICTPDAVDWIAGMEDES